MNFDNRSQNALVYCLHSLPLAARCYELNKLPVWLSSSAFFLSTFMFLNERQSKQ